MRANIVFNKCFMLLLALISVLVEALPAGFSGSLLAAGQSSSNPEWQKDPLVFDVNNSRHFQAEPLSPRSAQQCVWIDNGWDCDLRLPKISEFVRRMRDTTDGGAATPDNSVWFWTNLQGRGNEFVLQNLELPVQWLERNNVHYYNIFDAQNNDWFRKQKDWVYQNGDQIEEGEFADGEDARAELYQCQYQATATAALNPDAYIFTRGDQEWDPDSTWANTELPALTKNQHIQRIWRVDPRPGACGDKKLFWLRGRDAEVEFGEDEECLVTDITSS